MIIGIRGFIGVGKDTTANCFVDLFGYKKLSFADSLKDAVSAIFGWDRSLLQGDTEESRTFREIPDLYWSKVLGRVDFTPRQAMQLMGTEAGRKVFGADLWIGSTLKKAQAHEKTVIADCRFPNETAAIRAAGGKIVWVVRGNLPEWYSIASLENVDLQKGSMRSAFPDVHLSEWALVGEKADVLLINDYTMEDLPAIVKQVEFGLYKLRPDNFAIAKMNGNIAHISYHAHRERIHEEMA